MPLSDSLTLTIAIDRLSQSDPNHYAIWVLECPFPGGYTHSDRVWNNTIDNVWSSWQQFFSLREVPRVPHVPSAYVPQFLLDDWLEQVAPKAEGAGYTGRLMQGLGVTLWDWLFDGPIRQSLERSLGIAMGQDQPLHLKLEIRSPELIAIPWEIMQPQPGRPAVSVDPNFHFSRTNSVVDPLNPTAPDTSLRILLVLGQDDVGQSRSSQTGEAELQLPQEAEALKRLLERSASQLS